MVQGHIHVVDISGTRSFLVGWGRGYWYAWTYVPSGVDISGTTSPLGGGYLCLHIRELQILGDSYS